MILGASTNPFVMSINTLKASRWELFKARLFGQKIKGFDGECAWEAYRWRGKYYLTNFALHLDIGDS